MSVIPQIEHLFDTLNRYRQLLVIEKLVRRMRQDEIDPEKADQELDGLENEDFNAPYPIPEGTYSEDQLKPHSL